MRTTLLFLILFLHLGYTLGQATEVSSVTPQETTPEVLLGATPVEPLSPKSIETELEKLNKKFDNLTDKKIQFGLSLGYRFISNSESSQYQIASISPLDSTLQLDRLEDDAVILSTSIIFNPKIPTQKLSNYINTQLAAYVISRNSNKIIGDLSVVDRMILNDLKVYAEIGNQNTERVSDIVVVKQNDDIKSDINPFLAFGFIDNLKDTIKSFRLQDGKQLEIASLKRMRKKVKRLVFWKYFIDYFIDRVSINANLNLIEFSSAQKELSFNRSLEGGLGVSYMINDNLYFGANWDVFFSRQLHEHLKALEGQQITNQGNIVSSGSDLDIENDDFFFTKNVNGLSFKVIATF